MDVHFPEKRIYRYKFVKNVKFIGFPNHSITLLLHNFERAKGNPYFMWREDPNNPSHLSNRQNVIIVIQNALSKYFSRAHKRIVRTMTENAIFYRISSAHFRLIYREITGDNSAPDTKQQAEFNLKTQIIMGNLDSSICRSLRIYNARKSKYDKFWEILAAKIEEMTAADDRRHATASIETEDIVVNMALAISGPDLQKKCCQETEKAGLTAEETPSFPGLSCNLAKRCYNTFSAKLHGSIFC